DSRKRLLLTLHPRRILQLGLEAQDLSGNSHPRFATLTASKKILNSEIRYLGRNTHGDSFPFPPNTKGYMYYHLDNGSPLIAGELRMRICDAPSDFERGHDLPDIEGFGPWSIPLYTLVRRKSYAGFGYLLSQEKLVDADLLSDIRRLPLRSFERPLYDFEQPFITDLSQHKINFTLLSRKVSVQVVIQHSFEQTLSGSIVCYPYAGKIEARFIRSPLPEDADHPTYLMQFLKFLTPIQCVIPEYQLRIRRPQIGDVLQRLDIRTGVYRPWKYVLRERAGGKAIADFIGIEP
ncbi:hypothetical protein CVT25_013888, partial [Psilocybe cyanescens]